MTGRDPPRPRGLPGAHGDATSCLFGLGNGPQVRFEVGRIDPQDDQLKPGRLAAGSGGGALVHAQVFEHNERTLSTDRLGLAHGGTPADECG